MTKAFIKPLSAIFVLLCIAIAAGAQTRPQAKTTASPDLEVKMKSGDSDRGSTMYFKGTRQRMEHEGGAMLFQCDLKRMVQVNDQAKTYLIMPFDADNMMGMMADATPTQPQPTQTRRGGVVTQTYTITDTQERKQMFGYTARRIKTSMVSEASPDACSPDKSRMETDGWYIDLPFNYSCSSDRPAAPRRTQRARPECEDEHRFEQIGTGKLGFPVLVTTTFYDNNGRATTSTMEVVELSRATLDPALFEVPAGYKEAKNMQEYVMAMTSANDGSQSDNQTSSGSMTDNAAPTPSVNNTNSATNAALGPKKPGMIRVGVVTAKTQMGQGSTGYNPGEAIRNSIINFLSSPAIEVTPLASHLPAQIEAEAKQKECDFILYSTVTQKQGGGGFGSFMRKAAPVAAVAGVAATPSSTAGVLAESVATTAVYTAADVASSVKAKDEITFEYKLFPTGSATPRLANTAKAKAKTDGEDVLSPLIEQAAGVVLTEVTKK